MGDDGAKCDARNATQPETYMVYGVRCTVKLDPFKWRAHKLAYEAGARKVMSLLINLKLVCPMVDGGCPKSDDRSLKSLI